jgi:hypothetical protein
VKPLAISFTFNFIINTMLDFENPFAKNELSTFGKWHQCPSVIDNKRIVLLLHGNLPFFCNFALESFFHILGFLKKNYGNIFHLFGGNPPIMRPFLTLSLGAFSSSILLWFIQTFILWWKNFFF